MKKLVALLLVLLLAACSGGSEPAATEEPVQEEPVEETIDVTPLLDIKAGALRETPLYRLEGEELREVGTLCEGTLVDTSSDSRGNYVRLKGGEYYVSGKDIDNSGRYYRFENHLLKLGTVETNADFSLYVVKGR